MAALSNTPSEQTMLRLEARKSFNLGLWFVNEEGRALDLTTGELTLTIGKRTARVQDVTSQVLSKAHTPVLPGVGYVHFQLQADDLDLAPDTYLFDVTLELEGYSGVVVKGELEIVDNTEFASLADSYDGDAAQNLTVKLMQHTATVRVGPVLPPNWTYPELNPDPGPVFELPWFLPSEYDAVGDGVADDGDALRAALNAAATSGGVVQLEKDKTYAWSGELPIKNGVFLIGVRNNGAPGTDEPCDLIALDATSKITMGKWGQYERPGGLNRLRIDGNGLGDPLGLLQIQGVHGQIEDVFVQRGAGDNVLFDAAQNLSMKALFSCLAGDAAIAIKNGSGGLNFYGCHAVFSPRSLVVFDDDGVSNNAYPFGSAHINWFGGILETSAAVPISTILDLRAGANMHFFGTGISINGATTSSEECAVKISNPDFTPITTIVGFHSCNFNGGTNQYPIFRMQGDANKVVFTGDTYWQFATAFLVADASSPIVHMYGSFQEGANCGDLLATENVGNLVGVFNPKVIFDDYRLPAALPTAIAVRREEDANAGLRFFMNRDGTLSWNDGDGFNAKAAASFDATNQVLGISGLKVTGRRMSVISQQNIAAAGAAVTIDSQTSHFHNIYLNGGSVASMTITNPVDGAELELWVTQDGTGGRTYAWPANIQWMGVAPIDMGPNDTVVVRLRYHAGLAKWVETGKVSKITTPRFFETTTATAFGTAAKTATIGNGYTYQDGDVLSVIFTNGNLIASPTLNIDGLGAKSIYAGGAAVTQTAGALVAGGRMTVRYDAATDRFDVVGMPMNYDTIAAATMQAGTSTTVGWMSPALVKVAIDALSNPTSTTAALAAIGNAVNTTGKYAGKQYFNTTTNKPVWATGSTAAATWVDATGATAHTPV